MTYVICSIRDVLTSQYTDLKLFPNIEVAKRWFDEICSESKFSRDLQLFKLGEYDTFTGITITCSEFVKAGE